MANRVGGGLHAFTVYALRICGVVRPRTRLEGLLERIRELPPGTLWVRPAYRPILAENQPHLLYGHSMDRMRNAKRK